MTSKTPLMAAFLVGSAIASHAQTLPSDSAFNTFITDGGIQRHRVLLEGAPRTEQLDRLLPKWSAKMFRVVLTCAIANSGAPKDCRRDKSSLYQFGDIKTVSKTLKGTRVSASDMKAVIKKESRLQVVVYLDDPTRPLDRSNIWSVPTPPPPPPPPPVR